MPSLTNQQIQYILCGIAALVFAGPWLKSLASRTWKIKLPKVSIPWGSSNSTPATDHDHFTPADVVRFSDWLRNHGNDKLADQLIQLPTSYYVCPDELPPIKEDMDRDPDIEP